MKSSRLQIVHAGRIILENLLHCLLGQPLFEFYHFLDDVRLMVCVRVIGSEEEIIFTDILDKVSNQ